MSDMSHYDINTGKRREIVIKIFRSKLATDRSKGRGGSYLPPPSNEVGVARRDRVNMTCPGAVLARTRSLSES